MKGRNQKEMHKLIANAVIFAIVMALTFWSVFRGQNFAGIADAVGQMTGTYMAAAAFLAVLFVAGEGCMIWYLLRGIGEQSTLPRCISYSFIGFFLFGHHAFGDRRTTDAVILYAA